MLGLQERNFIEISKDDLQRMQGAPPSDHYSKFLKEKFNLKALSDERAHRWPNTIKALHEKRLLAKKEESEMLERERLTVDAMEAKFKAEKRKEMIDRAHKMLLLPHMIVALSRRQTDNTLKEREAQILYQRKAQEHWDLQEKKQQMIQKEQLEKWDKEEEEKLHIKKAAVKSLANAQLHQLEELKKMSMENKIKKEIEKNDLRKIEEQDRLFEEEKESLKQKRMKEMNQDLVFANKLQQEMKEKERRREKELDQEIAEFALKKEKLMDEGKRLEERKLATRAKQRDAIMEKLSTELLATKVDTERKCQLEQTQKKDEEEKKERERIEKQKKDWEDCDKSRKMQVMLRQKKMDEDAENDKYEAERSWQRAWQCKLECEEFERDQFLKNKSFAEHHVRMIEYNKNKKMQEEQSEIEDECKTLQRMKEENDEICLENLKM